MSGRLLKMVLKEHEESKQRNLHDEEEEEEEEEDDEESGARSSINPFDLLNEGDEDPEEIEIDDETIVGKKNEYADNLSKTVDNVQPVSKNKSKKNKESGSNVSKAEISLDETIEALGLNANSKQEKVQEPKANADSSEKASSPYMLEIDPKYLNLENELKRMYGSKAMRSFESGTQGGGSSRQGRGGRRGVHHITKTVLISPKENWSRWDRSFSMEFLETKDGNNYFRYTLSPSYEQAQRAFQAAQSIHDLNGVASVLIHHPPVFQVLQPNLQISINDLPDDLLMDILSRAAPTLTRYGEVCRSWRTLIRERQTKLTLLEAPVGYFPLRGQGFKNLVSISVDYRLIKEGDKLFTDAHLRSIATDFPALQRLELLGCDGITPTGLISMVRPCEDLVYLHIYTI